MTVKSIDYEANFAQNLDRGPSRSIWGDCPVTRLQEAPNEGMYFYDEFIMVGNTPSTSGGAYTGSLGQWSVYADQHGVLDTDPDAEGGVIALGSGANSTVNVSMTSTAGAFKFVGGTPYAMTKKMWFECRVAIGSIVTAKRDAFIGITDIGAPAVNNVIGSSTNTLATAPDLFGFHFRSTTNPTDVGLAFNVAGGTVQYPTGLQTLSNTVLGAALAAYVAGSTTAAPTGFIKLGWIFDPNALAVQISTAGSGQTLGVIARPVLKLFVNGLPAPTFLSAAANIQAATFPTGFMSPAISFLSRSGTAPGDFYVDWIRCAQLANT